MLKRKRLTIAIGVLGALAILLGAAGAVFAQGPRPPVQSWAQNGKGPLGTVGCPGLGCGWGLKELSMVGATAEATGLTVREVIAALEEGQTFAQIAESQDVDPQAIVDAFLAPRETALTKAVDRGWLTQEQADRILGEMAEHAFERLEQTWEGEPSEDRWIRRHAFRRGVRVGACLSPCR